MRWLDTYVLHVGIPDGPSFNGSGDRTIDYVSVAVMGLLSGCVSVVWSLVDRRPRGHARLAEGLWIYVRIVLAYTMFAYGFTKLLEGQFPAPTPARLAQPFGEASPMGLLWTFMGSSQPYTMFTGTMEILGGALLLSRRTATLGALVVCGVMVNVVALNVCYDVPVKLYSSHLLVTAALLAVPDLGRLLSVLVLNRATTPRPPRRPLPRRWMERARRPALIALTGWLVYYWVEGDLERIEKRRPPAEVAPYLDSFDVDSFTANGGAGADAVRWRVVNAGRGRTLVITTMDGTATRVAFEVDVMTGVLTLTTEDKVVHTLTTEWTSDTTVVLRGHYQGVDVVATLRARGIQRYLLVNRGFHWVNEVPFNR